MVYAILVQCASLICPACDVTAWVREGQQYPGPGKGPHKESMTFQNALAKRYKICNISYSYYHDSKTSTLNFYPSLTLRRN